ncbi:MAG: SBBP repeat-containing protein [Trueperaceae bacterium]|nr:SBBP repeat-containing protein [Trueperaceae bacterium]
MRARTLKGALAIVTLSLLVACPKTVIVTLTPYEVTLPAGGTQQFTATVVGAGDKGVKWSASGGIVSGTGNVVSYTAPSAAGTYEVTATSKADPSRSATATVAVTGVTVAIVPVDVLLAPGGTKAFTATVTGAADPAVAWTATGGTIEGAGHTVTYTAPSVEGSYQVTATSVIDNDASATANVTVSEGGITITPSVIGLAVGESCPITATVTGLADTHVVWSTSGGTITGSGLAVTYTAPGSAGSYAVTVASAAVAGKSATAIVTVSEVGIGISPVVTSLLTAASQEFTATVTGAADTSVLWSTTGGMIHGSGNVVTYTAPELAGSYEVTATSVADASRSATAIATVGAVGVAIDPTGAALAPGGTQSFTATVSGTLNTAVIWSATGGTLEGTGNTVVYTAPEVAGIYVVTATSLEDASRSASAAVSVGEVAVSLDPPSAVLEAGGSQAFTAIVTGTRYQAVTWSATGGTISGSGNTITYTAPATAGDYQLIAVSRDDTTKSATADITVGTVVVVIDPTRATLDTSESRGFTATVSGTRYATVSWSATGGTISGSGNTITYTAPATPGDQTLTATSNFDSNKSAAASVRVREVVVGIDPVSAEVATGVSIVLTATVTDARTSAVVWSATGGTFSGTGPSVTYTAPDAGGTYHVTATSVASPHKSATATVTVTEVAVTIEPVAAPLAIGELQPFRATVTGTRYASVIWTITGGYLSGTGNNVSYTAPSLPGTYQVTATSTADSRRSATATVTVTNGATQWSRQFGTAASDLGRGVAGDAAGNVLVTGSTFGELSPGPDLGCDDAFLRKYDATGNLLWTRQFGTPATDRAWSVAADASGNLVVVGFTYGSFAATLVGDPDTFVRKYDPSGNELWTRQFGVAGAGTWGYGTAVDGFGNVLVVGHTTGNLVPGSHAGGSDAFVRKYDASGNVLWTRQFGSSSYDVARRVAVDGSGDVLVVGGTEGALVGTGYGGTDAFVRRYDTYGNLVWTRQFGTAEDDRAWGVAVDPTGNMVVIAGSTSGGLWGSNLGGNDAFLRTYDLNGNLEWTRQFGSLHDDLATDVALDAAGNVVVVGDTEGSLGGSANSGMSDGYVRKYDRYGYLLWKRQFGTSADDCIQGVAVDASRNVLAAGFTAGSLVGANAGGTDVVVWKLSP